jgi:hypothetical protein
MISTKTKDEMLLLIFTDNIPVCFAAILSNEDVQRS